MNVLLLGFHFVEFDIYCHDLLKGSVSISSYHSTTYSVTSGLETVHSTITSSSVVKVLTASIIWEAKNVTECHQFYLSRNSLHKNNSVTAIWDHLAKVKKNWLYNYMHIYQKYLKMKHIRTITLKKREGPKK